MIKGAIFIQFQLTLDVFSILISCVILSLALTALQSDNFNSCLFLASHFASPMIKYRQNRRCNRAFERDRTADLNLTMVALCLLSYRGIQILSKGVLLRYKFNKLLSIGMRILYKFILKMIEES